MTDADPADAQLAPQSGSPVPPQSSPQTPPLHDPNRLLDELSKEYYAVVGIVSGFDQRLMTIKGWSVTISLAALGFGFSRNHYALFALAAVTGAVFWIIDILTKRHQLRYYPRMRDIEVAAFELNNVELKNVKSGISKVLSAPRVDWTWSLPERQPEGDQRDLPPEKRPQETLKQMLHGVPWMGNVILPHIVAIVLGIALFFYALFNGPGLENLAP
jgi:hypothetical protein